MKPCHEAFTTAEVVDDELFVSVGIEGDGLTIHVHKRESREYLGFQDRQCTPWYFEGS